MKTTIKKTLKYIFPVIILLLVILFFQSCASSFGYAEEEVFTSPQGSNTIIVKYDLWLSALISRAQYIEKVAFIGQKE